MNNIFRVFQHAHHGEEFDLLDVIGGASVGIIGFVILALVIYKMIAISLPNTEKSISTKSNIVQILFAALIGITPGCGGAIAIGMLYKEKKVTFGALVAAFTTTMGEGTFLLLASNGGEFVGELFSIIGITFAVGVLAGYVVDFYKVAPKVTGYIEKEEKTYDNHSYSNVINIIFPIILIVLSLIVVPFSLAEFVEFEAEGNLETLINIAGPSLVILLIAYHLIIKFVGNVEFDSKCKYRKNLVIVFKEIAFVTLYIMIGLIIAEVVVGQWIGEHGFEVVVEDFGTVIILLAVLIGLTPGCAGFVVLVAFYTEGKLPFSALIAASVATNGDAVFSLVAKDKKAILIVSLITGILGLALGLVIHPFNLFG